MIANKNTYFKKSVEFGQAVELLCKDLFSIFFIIK